MGQFFDELKRRNVLRVAIAYLVVSWLLIQVADTIFPAYGLPDSALTILITILAIGFVPVLVLAWAFELTPEGVKRDQDVDRSTPASLAAGKNLDRLIIVVLALALGYFAVDKFVLGPARDVELVEEATLQGRAQALAESYGEKSIAVLPFINMSSDPDQEYFSDGISEELLNLLAQIPELRVISRSSAFSFKGKNIAIPTVAEQLNVAHVLEGSVRKVGNRVRITAQLIEASSDSHLWSQSYDRELDDIFAVQDEIASAVVAALKLTLLGPALHVKETDPEAYTLYLQARHLLLQIREEHIPQAEALVRRALELDPDDIRLLEALGWVYFQQAGANDLSVDESCELGREEVLDRMLAIYPDHPLTVSFLAFRARYCEGDLPESARLTARAFALDPTNPSMVEEAAGMAVFLRRFDIAIEFREYAVARDPLCAMCFHFLGNTYVNVERWDDAEAAYQTAISLGFQSDASIVWTRLLKGDPEAALEVLDTVPEDNQVARAAVLHDLGRQADFEAALNQLHETLGDVSPLSVAMVYAWTGANDAAFEWLAKLDPKNLPVAQVAYNPVFSKLYGDPRWTSLLETVGRSPAQLAAIEFEVTLPE